MASYSGVSTMEKGEDPTKAKTKANSGRTCFSQSTIFKILLVVYAVWMAGISIALLQAYNAGDARRDLAVRFDAHHAQHGALHGQQDDAMERLVRRYNDLKVKVVDQKKLVEQLGKGLVGLGNSVLEANN